MHMVRQPLALPALCQFPQIFSNCLIPKTSQVYKKKIFVQIISLIFFFIFLFLCLLSLFCPSFIVALSTQAVTSESVEFCIFLPICYFFLLNDIC